MRSNNALFYVFKHIYTPITLLSPYISTNSIKYASSGTQRFNSNIYKEDAVCI